MILETQAEIITALETIESVITVDSGIGDFEELIKQPYKLPALLVVYAGARFVPAEIIGAAIAKHVMTFTVLAVIKNMRSNSAGASDSFDMIEKVREKLIGLITSYGRSWPVTEDLVFADSGTYVYGLEYTITAETTGV